jgi:hypothetical protein
MRFWWRELGGWLFIGLGLLCFAEVWHLCRGHWILEAWPITLIGIIVFWGGIHLLKVAVAARICGEAQDRLYPAPVPEPKRRESRPGVTGSSTPRRSIASR